MTQFFGAANVSQILRADDFRHAQQSRQMDREIPEFADRGYASPWWPRSSFNDESGMILKPVLWEQYELVSGSVSRFGYRGITRDANNSPVGGVTVKCFRTADDSKTADDVVSDINGNFVISTPHYEAHYLVMRKSGAPEISGVTVSSQFPNT